MTREKMRFTPIFVGVCLIAVWWLAAENSTHPRVSVAVSPANQQEVLFGAYSCRLRPGLGIEATADFTSTGDLVSPAAAGRSDGGNFFFPTLKTESTILDPNPSFDTCESLVEKIERLLASASCTVGAREVATPDGDFLGIRYACQGSRAALVKVIGAMGRATLTGTP